MRRGRGGRGSRGRGRGLGERGNSKGRKNQRGNSQVDDADHLKNNSSLNLGQDSEDDFKSLRLDAATDVELDKSKSQDSFVDKKQKKKEKKSKKKSKTKKHKKKEKRGEDTIGSSGEEDEGEESEIEDDSSEEQSGSDDSEDPSDATTSGSGEGESETENSDEEEGETREDGIEKDDAVSNASEDQPKNLKKKYQMKLKEKSKKQRAKAAQAKDDQRGKSKKQTKKKLSKKPRKEEKPKPLEKVNISDERMKDMWKSDNAEKTEKQTIEKISSRVYSFARKDSIEDDNPDEPSSTNESEGNSDCDDIFEGEETKNKEDTNLFLDEKAKIKELEFVLDFLSKQNIQIRKYKKLTDKILKDKECPQSIKEQAKSLQVEFVQMVKVDVIKFVESSNNLLAILNNNTICVENLYASKKISPLTFHKTMASLAKLFEKHKTIKLNFGTVWEKQK